MEKFLQTLIDAVAVGSLYALIAIGYTMVYGVLKFINFAHSDIFVMGAWVSLSVAVGVGLGGPTSDSMAQDWVWWALIATVAAAAGATLVEWALARRRGLDRFSLTRSRAAGLACTIAVWAWFSMGLAQAAGALHRAGMPPLVSGGLILLCAMATCGLIGFVIERFAYKPLRRAPRLNVLITAIGVSLLLQNLGQLPIMFGTRPQPMPQIIPRDAPLATLAGVKIWPVDVIGAATAVALMFAMDFLVYRSRFGRSMRAVSYNPTTASLMGIPVDRVVSATFVIGAALAAAAGFLYGQKYSGLNQAAAATWVLLGLKAFVAAVVGGIGNIRGAMLGGLLIGLLEFFGAAYLSAAMRDVYVFSLLILALLFRPSGILGRSEIEKV